MSYHFNDTFLEELHEKNPIEEVVSSYVALKRSGRMLSGLCPFHNEKTPSFFVYPETSSYYCFGCGAGGDVITFVRSIENLDYIDSVKFLADRAGMSVPESGGSDISAALKKRIFEANRAAARYFHEALFKEDGKAQLAYLEKRGVSQKMITRFGLGAAPEGWHNLGDHLQSLGFKKEELVAANLMRCSDKNGKKYYYDAFSNKVMFPVIDLRGNVVAFGGRVLDNSKPKYINTSDTLVYKKSRELFALNLAKNGNNGKLILCEGYMDVIALHSAGFTNAVAGLGTALTPEQVNLISRYAEEVYLCYDSDEAGQKAVRAALSLFSKTGMKVKVIRLEGGKDPDEIIKNHGRDKFRRLLEASNNDIEYKLSIARDKYLVETADGRVGYLKEATEILASYGALECDVYSSKLSDELGVSKDAIMSQIGREKRKRERRHERNEFSEEQKRTREMNNILDSQRNKNMRAAKAEDVILITLLNNSSFYSKLKDELFEDLFITPLNKKLAGIIFSRLANGESVDLPYLSQYLDSNESGAVARLFANKHFVSNTVSECEDCIKVLKEEQEKLDKKNPAELSNADFANIFYDLNKKNKTPAE